MKLILIKDQVWQLDDAAYRLMLEDLSKGNLNKLNFYGVKVGEIVANIGNMGPEQAAILLEAN